MTHAEDLARAVLNTGWLNVSLPLPTAAELRQGAAAIDTDHATHGTRDTMNQNMRNALLVAARILEAAPKAGPRRPAAATPTITH